MFFTRKLHKIQGPGYLFFVIRNTLCCLKHFFLCIVLIDKEDMKTVLPLILAVFFFASCSKDDSVITKSKVETTLDKGTWVVDYYWDSDHDETSNFAGYNFSFSSNGIITATNGSSSHQGTWTTGNDDSTVKLILDFSSPDDFKEISDDWHVTESTDSKISLEDVSGGNGGTDYLVFIKN